MRLGTKSARERSGKTAAAFFDKAPMSNTHPKFFAAKSQFTSLSKKVSTNFWRALR